MSDLFRIDQKIQLIKSPAKIAFDCENAKDKSVTCISFAWDDASLVLDTRNWKLDDFMFLVETLKSKNLVGFNAGYDTRLLEDSIAHYNKLPVYFDVYHACRWLYPREKSYSLKSMAVDKLGMKDWGSAKELIDEYGDIPNVPGDILHQYAAIDAEATWRLFRILEPEIEKQHMWKVMEIETHVIPAVNQMRIDGVKIDPDVLGEIRQELQEELFQLTNSIHKLAGEPISPSEFQRLSGLLFDKLKIPSDGLRKTKTGFVSTGADVLEKIVHLHPIVNEIIQWRKVSKLLSPFVSELQWAYENSPDGRAHPNWNSSGTVTSRWTCTSPNLHNLPNHSERGKAIRKAIVAGEGNLILAADYSQIQLVILSVMAKSQKMMQVFVDGRDIHSETAKFVFRVNEVTKSQRQKAKAINFGLIFGGGPGIFRAFGYDWNQCQILYDRFFDEYDLNPYKRKCEAQAHRGYVESYHGRRIWLPQLFSREKTAFAHGVYKIAMNYPIQATESDIVKIALTNVFKRFGTEIKYLMQVHDELVFEIPENNYQFYANSIRDEMMSVEFPVQLRVDMEIGHNFRELAPLEFPLA